MFNCGSGRREEKSAGKGRRRVCVRPETFCSKLLRCPDWFSSFPFLWGFVDLAGVYARHRVSLLQIPTHKALCV